MKLYKEVLIESAEQAEALPVGTVARSHGSDGEPTHACLRMANGWWCTDETNDDGTPFLVPHVGMVRDTAFVPIEAEEDIVLVYSDEPDRMWANETYYSVREAQSIADGRPDYLPAVEVRTRSVTPWEAV